jgi:hypothetical protein
MNFWEEKQKFLEPIVNICLITLQIHFVLLWRVFVAQYEGQSPYPSIMSRRFFQWLDRYWTRDLLHSL